MEKRESTKKRVSSATKGAMRRQQEELDREESLRARERLHDYVRKMGSRGLYVPSEDMYYGRTLPEFTVSSTPRVSGIAADTRHPVFESVTNMVDPSVNQYRNGWQQGTGVPMEPLNPEFDLMAPYMGVEDYLTDKGISLTARALAPVVRWTARRTRAAIGDAVNKVRDIRRTSTSRPELPIFPKWEDVPVFSKDNELPTPLNSSSSSNNPENFPSERSYPNIEPKAQDIDPEEEALDKYYDWVESGGSFLDGPPEPEIAPPTPAVAPYTGVVSGVPDIPNLPPVEVKTSRPTFIKNRNSAGDFELKDVSLNPDEWVVPDDFESELDWTPSSWFGQYRPNKWTKEEEEELASYVPQLRWLEYQAKKNGTWLKNEDGTPWNSHMEPTRYNDDALLTDPRIWVMSQAPQFKERWAPEVLYSGTPSHYVSTVNGYLGNRWGDSKQIDAAMDYATTWYGNYGGRDYASPKALAETSDEYFEDEIVQLEGDIEDLVAKMKKNPEDRTQYLNEINNKRAEIQNIIDRVPYNGGTVLGLRYPSNANVAPAVDAQGVSWGHVPIDERLAAEAGWTKTKENQIVTSAKGYKVNNGPYISTDDIVKENRRLGYDVTKVDNVHDSQVDGELMDDVVIHEDVPAVSVAGNTGRGRGSSAGSGNIFRGIAGLAGLSAIAAGANAASQVQPQYKRGGKLSQLITGSVYDLSNKDIYDLIKRGYKVSYV